MKAQPRQRIGFEVRCDVCGAYHFAESRVLAEMSAHRAGWEEIAGLTLCKRCLAGMPVIDKERKAA